jgi:hypothetical protein
MKTQKYVVTDGIGKKYPISASSQRKALEMAMKKLEFAPCKIELKKEDNKCQ